MTKRCFHCGCPRHSWPAYLRGAVCFKIAMAIPVEWMPMWFIRSNFWAWVGDFAHDQRECCYGEEKP